MIFHLTFRILLEQFSSGRSIDTDSVEVLYNWTFEKFCSRLQIMQEVWQAHSEDPENFDLDEFNHPWSEQGERHGFAKNHAVVAS